ncbi:MAG: prepilin peptidase [Actinomycetales bacterium]|nr:prepilin peptidase [Actinomycetales bacterium]
MTEPAPAERAGDPPVRSSRAGFPWITWSPARLVAAALSSLAAAAVAVVAVGASPALPGLLVLALATGPLSIVDIVAHRLPNPLVLIGLAGALAAVAVAAIVLGDPQPLLGGLLGGAAMGGVYLALALLTRGGIGAGDVKLAAPLGVMLGGSGGSVWVLGLAAGFVVGALAALAAVIARRASLRSRVAFGPAMLAGAWFAVLAGRALGALPAF